MTRRCTYSHAHAGTKVSHFGADADAALTEHRLWELEEMVRLLQEALAGAQAGEAWALRERDAALAAGLRLQLDLADAAADREQLAARLSEADAVRDMAAVGMFDDDVLDDVEQFAAVAS